MKNVDDKEILFKKGRLFCYMGAKLGQSVQK